MKRLIIALSVLAYTAGAQNITVKDATEKFSSGSQPALVTIIHENTAEEVMQEWKKVLKDFKNEKVKDDKGEVFGDNVLIKEWGNNPVDVYTRFDEDKKDRTVKMAVAVDLGGAYLSNQDKEKTRYMEKLIKDFAVKMTKAPIEASLKQNEKLFAKLEDQQRDLQKENKNLNGDIINYKNKIAKAEKEVAVKDVEIEKKKEEVKVQKKVVDASSDAVSEQAKSSKKIYDKLNDQLNDLEKDRKNQKDDIQDYQEKIKKAESDIKTNEQNQEKKKQELESQKKIVEDLKKKLDGVK